jgi:putative aldouronate transport system permease protein
MRDMVETMKRAKKVIARWQLYLLLLIPLLYIIIFHYLPIGGLQIALKAYDPRYGIAGSPWVGFRYFEKFLGSYQFIRVLRNTLTISAYSLLAGCPLPILFALLLNAMPYVRYKKLVQTVTYVPHFISTVVMVGILMQVLNMRSGLYGVLYNKIAGVPAPDLFGSPSAFRHMYVWSGIWQNLGWDTIIYLAALMNVDLALNEAAQIDGANRLQRLWHIDLPTVLPTASIMLILAAGKVMNVGFEKVYLMQNDLNISASEVISTYVYKVGMVTGGGDFSYATAIGLFNSIINFVLIMLVNSVCGRLGGSSLW